MSSPTHVPASHARQVTTDEELTLQGEFGWAVYDVQRLIGRIFDRRMREIGLTRAQGRVLAVLRRDDGQTQTAIADRLDMERAPLGKLVDRLEEAGFVTRCIDEGDRRVKRVFLTDNGNLVLDATLSGDEDLLDLYDELNSVPGVVDHGLFLDEADEILIEHDDGTVERLTR